MFWENFSNGIRETPEPVLFDLKDAIFISDIHIPFQDNKALKTALSLKSNTLVILGDLIDYASIGRFTKNPSIRLETEIQRTREFLIYAKQKFKRVIWLAGNHELRYQHFIWDKAPQLFGLDTMTMEKLFNIGGRLEYYSYGTKLQFGSLYGIHGSETGTGGTVNVARSKIYRAMDNVIFGHSHVSQTETITKLDGSIIGSWSMGCLCYLNPQWKPVSGWQHGFAFVEFSGKEFQVRNYKIHGEKIY